MKPTLFVLVIACILSACNSGSKSDQAEEKRPTALWLHFQVNDSIDAAPLLDSILSTQSQYADWVQLYQGFVDSTEYGVLFGNIEEGRNPGKAIAAHLGLTEPDVSITVLPSDREQLPLSAGDFCFTVRHRIAEFSKWQADFKSQERVRAEAGVIVSELYKVESDTNDLMLIFKARDIHTVSFLAASPEMQYVVKNSGVISQPELTYWTVLR